MMVTKKIAKIINDAFKEYDVVYAEASIFGLMKFFIKGSGVAFAISTPPDALVKKINNTMGTVARDVSDIYGKPAINLKVDDRDVSFGLDGEFLGQGTCLVGERE